MKKKRITIFYVVLGLAFMVLLLRLFEITIIKGDYYRDFSESKRIKQINSYAARGNILDRNGEILAGNKPVYNIILYKDRLDRVEKSKKNSVLSDVINIFEKEGINYLEDYFFGIYEYKYTKNQDYFNSKMTPKELMVDIIIKNDLIEDIVKSEIVLGNASAIKYRPVNRIIDYLQTRGKNFPIKPVESSNSNLEFINNKDYKKLIDEKIISEDTSAYDYLIRDIKGDKSVIAHLLDHPLSRKIIYDIVKEKKLEENIELTDLIYISDLEYIEHKAYLNKLSDKITLESNPEDDFLNLVKENTFDKLLQTSSTEKEKVIIPAEILLNQLEEKGINTNITFEKKPQQDDVQIVFKDKEIREKELAIDKLIRLAKENNLEDKLILDKNVLLISEETLVNDGIYPKIYKKSWEYSYVRDKKDLLDYNNVKKNTKARDLFNSLKKEYLLEGYDDYQAFGMISIYNKVEKQYYRAYVPIELAKNITQKSLASIEEKIPKDYGFEAVVQPNRYYPNGTVGSHLLGYIGKISENYELEEYVEHKQYDYSDIVGKAGLEESFEDTLRGSKGKTTVYTNVMGQTTDILEEIPSVPGNNLYSTIDINLQKEAEKILYDIMQAAKTGEPYKSFTGDSMIIDAKNLESGAAVVMNVKTGEILAMASYPNYDPNLFVNGISETDWKKLSKDTENDIYEPRPLLNIATQAQMPPGSTFKTITGLAALNKGMSPHQPVTCMGFLEEGDQTFNCLIYSLGQGTHGTIDLYDALKYSCNYYFYALALGENPKVPGELDFKLELEDIVEITDKLKMNKPTGIEINVPFESAGIAPSLYGKKNIVKFGLRNFLESELLKYKKRDITVEEYNKHISTILSWVDENEEIGRGEVMSRLEKMGYNSDAPLEGRYEGLADLIKYSYINQAIWTPSDSLNVVIGQGQNAYTPMQIAQLCSIIANEGVLNKPTLVKEIRNFDNSKVIFNKEVESEKIDIDPKYFKDIKEGMSRTSYKIQGRESLPVTIAGKTGTAESGNINPKTGELYEDFAWEMAYSPTENPEIVSVVILVQGEISFYSSYANTDLIYAYNKYVKKDSRFDSERESFLR